MLICLELLQRNEHNGYLVLLGFYDQMTANICEPQMNRCTSVTKQRSAALSPSITPTHIEQTQVSSLHWKCCLAMISCNAIKPTIVSLLLKKLNLDHPTVANFQQYLIYGYSAKPLKWPEAAGGLLNYQLCWLYFSLRY